MAKRFTDHDKWNDPWFRQLKPALKMFWLYLCDRCDGAGVWDPDHAAARFVLGMRYQPDDAVAAFKDRIQVLANGRWLLTKFIDFQYPGGLAPACRPHRAVIDLCIKHGIDHEPYLQGADGERPKEKGNPKGSRTGRPTLSEGLQDTDKDMEQDKDSNARAREPSHNLGRFVQWRTKDAARSADNLEKIEQLVATHGHKAVHAAAAKFYHREHKWPWPDNLPAEIMGPKSATGLVDEVPWTEEDAEMERRIAAGEMP